MKTKNVAVLTLSSWFGTGYLPKMPGTWGTLGSIPLWYAVSFLSLPLQIVATVVISGVAIVVSHYAEAIYGEHDVGKIVIDETAGLMVTVIAVPFALPQVIAAFLLFRVLDMAKPWPIRWLDKHVQGGVGVVVDDLLAGAIACGMLHGARLLYGGWW